MDSTELGEFLEWKQWPEACGGAPNRPGVYVFRMVQRIQRLKGMSDIVYIGSTTRGRRTLYDRLKDHLVVREPERNTAYYLERVRREVGALEISWKSFQTHREAMHTERTMLDRYVVDHIDFPPLNRQESGRKIRIAEQLFQQLSADEKVVVLDLVEKLKGQKVDGKPTPRGVADPSASFR